jgi:hypothetical protein
MALTVSEQIANKLFAQASVLKAALVHTVGFCAPSTMKLLPVIEAARPETKNPTISVLPSHYAGAFMNSLWIVPDFLTTVSLW